MRAERVRMDDGVRRPRQQTFESSALARNASTPVAPLPAPIAFCTRLLCSGGDAVEDVEDLSIALRGTRKGGKDATNEQ